MRYRKISTIWLKIICVPFVATLASLATHFILLKTIGVPDTRITMTDERPVKKNSLEEEFSDASWCYALVFDSGKPAYVCGCKKSGKEMFYERDRNGVNYSTETIKEYFSDQGMDEPIGNLDLYWKGKYLYYGYYPGVTFVRNIIVGIIDTAIYAGVATILLLGIYPIIMLTAFVIDISRTLISRKRFN